VHYSKNAIAYPALTNNFPLTKTAFYGWLLCSFEICSIFYGITAKNNNIETKKVTNSKNTQLCTW